MALRGTELDANRKLYKDLILDNLTVDSNLLVNVLSEKVPGTGVTVNGTLYSSIINENEPDAGVTIEGVLIKDGLISASSIPQSVIAGYDPKESVHLGTDDALSPSTYSPADGTITANANGPLPDIDGVAPVFMRRYLIKNQGDAPVNEPRENGIYVYTTLGDGGTPWQLTRSEDQDGSPASEVSAGNRTLVEQGTANTNTSWVVEAVDNTGELLITDPILGNNDPISWVQLTAGGGAISLPLVVSDGGTGTTSLTSGEVVLGNNTGPVSTVARGNLTADSSGRITVTTGTGVLLGAAELDVDESQLDLNAIGGAPLSETNGGTNQTSYSQFDTLVASGVNTLTTRKNNQDTTAPTVNDDDVAGYGVGSQWIDINAQKEYVCLNASTGAAVWSASASGWRTASVADMLVGDILDITSIDVMAVGATTTVRLGCDTSSFTTGVNIVIGAPNLALSGITDPVNIAALTAGPIASTVFVAGVFGSIDVVIDNTGGATELVFGAGPYGQLQRTPANPISDLGTFWTYANGLMTIDLNVQLQLQNIVVESRVASFDIDGGIGFPVPTGGRSIGLVAINSPDEQSPMFGTMRLNTTQADPTKHRVYLSSGILPVPKLTEIHQVISYRI